MLPEQRDSITNTFVVSLVLCIVCSLLVSSAAVFLKDVQDKNKLLDRQRNIVEASGLAEDAGALKAKEITDMFSNGTIEPKVVDLQTGDYVEDKSIANESFDERKAAKDEKMNAPIVGKYALGIEKREKYTWVYLVKDKQGKLQQVVLPIYGKGLWSTLYGFVAVKSDLKTINGLTYYEHGETPGLGGEVVNPKWKRQWQGKQIWKGEPFEDANLAAGVAKGIPTSENATYMVDGLSGATITSRGVDSMIKYWFSSEAFGPYLKKLASQQGASSGNPNG